MPMGGRFSCHTYWAFNCPSAGEVNSELGQLMALPKVVFAQPETAPRRGFQVMSSPIPADMLMPISDAESPAA